MLLMKLLAVLAPLETEVALLQKNAVRYLAGAALPLSIALGEETCVQGWFPRTKATTHCLKTTMNGEACVRMSREGIT
jgi:hypothetical protein